MEEMIVCECSESLKRFGGAKIPSNALVEVQLSQKKETQSEYDELVEEYNQITDALIELFAKKNKSYGNSFMRTSRAAMFNDIRRKFERYKAMFKEDNDSICVNKEANWNYLIPTMVDIIAYCVMNMMKEVHKAYYDSEGRMDFSIKHVLWCVCNSIIMGNDEINLAEMIESARMAKDEGIMEENENDFDEKEDRQ